MNSFQYDPKHFTNANASQIEARESILNLAKLQLSWDQSFFRDLALFTHSGNLARMLAIQEIYLLARRVPGLFLDFGTWKGSNMVLLENLRAIHDHFDNQRKILGFDTFKGYLGFTGGESKDPTLQNGTYALNSGYAQNLRLLISNHELANGKLKPIHGVIEGDAAIELPSVLETEGNPPIALAIFDLNAFEPTRDCLSRSLENMQKGSIVAFWQFLRPELTGERKAYSVLRKSLPKHQLSSAKNYPSLIFCELLE